MIKKAKLNSCAHCKTKENLHPVFSTCGKLYFICSLHKVILDALDKMIVNCKKATATCNAMIKDLKEGI